MNAKEAFLTLFLQGTDWFQSVYVNIGVETEKDASSSSVIHFYSYLRLYFVTIVDK